MEVALDDETDGHQNNSNQTKGFAAVRTEERPRSIPPQVEDIPNLEDLSYTTSFDEAQNDIEKALAPLYKVMTLIAF